MTTPFKQRLFIGEGNFSFTEAFIEKHPSTANSIIATDLTIQNNPQTHDRINTLRKEKVQIYSNVNATLIDKGFPNQRFSRIYWNCPHDGSNYKNQTLPPIIQDFFQSCRKAQKPNDQVLITLIQPEEKNVDSNKKDLYQGYVYNIVQAASLAGYRILKKRNFSQERYPGYQHTQTRRPEEASITKQGLRQFVFEKIDNEIFCEALQKTINQELPNLQQAIEPFNEKEILQKLNTRGIKIITPSLAKTLTRSSQKECKIKTDMYYGTKRQSFDCSTDYDSSDEEDLRFTKNR